MDLKKEFLKKYGIDLNTILPNGNDEQNKVSRFIEQQKQILITYCQTFNRFFNLEKISETKKEKFDEIVLTQMWYSINTEDYTAISGLDTINNTVLPISELAERFVAPLAKLDLKNNGFCYRGIL